MDNQQLKETIREEIKNEILSKLNVYLSTEPAGFGRTKTVVTITYDGLKVCEDDAYITECI